MLRHPTKGDPMPNYAQHFNPSETPQSEKADPRQVPNSAGGFAFAVDCWKRLERFLILGAEGGSYYATERKLTRENATCVLECCALDAERAVRTIVEVSDSGRAPKNDPAIFALALAAAHPTSSAARAAACASLTKVCRTGTHLFQFVEAVSGMRGWGRTLCRAVAGWYTCRSPEQLAQQIAKYGSRGNWTHKHLLQLAHPKTDSFEMRGVLGYATYGAADGVLGAAPAHTKRKYEPALLLPYLAGFEELKTASEKRTIALIQEHGYTHEMIADCHRSSKVVWAALAERMPVTATIRNLGKMSSIGLLDPLSSNAKRIADRYRCRRRRYRPRSSCGWRRLDMKKRQHPALVTVQANSRRQCKLTGQRRRQTVTRLPLVSRDDLLRARNGFDVEQGSRLRACGAHPQ